VHPRYPDKVRNQKSKDIAVKGANAFIPALISISLFFR
jgi:hypothetical protein